MKLLVHMYYTVHRPCDSFLNILLAANAPALPAVVPINTLVEVAIPAAPADCAVAIIPPAATPPPLAMAAIDIIFAAKEPATIVLENPMADRARGAPTTAAPPTNKPTPKTLALRQKPAKYKGPLYWSPVQQNKKFLLFSHFQK